MKVYVDEMPKDCLDCPCESEYYCNLLNEDVGCCKWGEIHKNCPLQSLADHDKQVRKEVYNEIKSKIVYYAVSLLDEAGNVKENVWGISKKDIDKILDQTQGEN